MIEPFNILFFLSVVLSVVLSALLVLASVRWKELSGEGVVQVVVLGDVGRSPRMQYHCLSLVQTNYTVDVVGYGGTPLIKELRDSESLKHWKLMELPKLNVLPKLLQYFIKVTFQTGNLLLLTLFYTKKPSYVLVQTPPAIPTLFVVVFSSIIRGSRLIVDYHNYGHTLLALTHGPEHATVKLAREFEKLFAGFAYANLCVSEAMKKDLSSSFKINAMILYDRPAGRFKPASLAMRHKLFESLARLEPLLEPRDCIVGSGAGVTMFTEMSASGTVTLREKRPFLLVSSTSWTVDEDFGLLLEALTLYEEKALREKLRPLPNIVCIITGKGHMKKYYEDIIASMKMKHVSICTLWLSDEDYPLLLGSADLGVCLHKSSSGLDLPMKVVDMFGCGLPVCAIKYNCLHELLRHGHNGLIFNNPDELATQLQFLAEGFPLRRSQLSIYRDNLSSFQSLRWHHYWKLHVIPLIQSSL